MARVGVSEPVLGKKAPLGNASQDGPIVRRLATVCRGRPTRRGASSAGSPREGRIASSLRRSARATPPKPAAGILQPGGTPLIGRLGEIYWTTVSGCSDRRSGASFLPGSPRGGTRGMVPRSHLTCPTCHPEFDFEGVPGVSFTAVRLGDRNGPACVGSRD